MLQKYLKKINDCIGEYVINFLLTLFAIFIVSLGTHYFLINDFANEQAYLSNKIYQKFIDYKDNNYESINSYYLIINYDIFVVNYQNYFKIDKKFTPIEKNSIEKSIFSFKLKKNIYLEYPYYVSYDYGDTIIKIRITLANTIVVRLFFLLILFSLSINIFYFWIVNKKTSKIDSLQSTAEQFALSQRTTSFLVRIMHHKLNTPLKTISTKSRTLLKTIINEDNKISSESVEKANTDYIKLVNSLQTIINVTKKLKVYNEIIQNESNLYKMILLTKETIDMLTDDEFKVDIQYSTRLYDIDKACVSSHEIIQIFIHQLKFSLSQLSDSITVKIFKSDENNITILYSDNGNEIDKPLKTLIDKNLKLFDISVGKIDEDSFDLLLNFIILNNNEYTRIRLLTTNKNGSVFELKLPIIKKKV